MNLLSYKFQLPQLPTFYPGFWAKTRAGWVFGQKPGFLPNPDLRLRQEKQKIAKQNILVCSLVKFYFERFFLIVLKFIL